MSDRTKLTLASLALMMLPYRIAFPVTALIVTAIVCMAIDMAREASGRMQLSRKFIAALSLYQKPEISNHDLGSATALFVEHHH